MQYHNGLSAAKRIGISYKTLLRWVEKGKLKAEHSESGRLLISEEQVEHFRLEIEREKAQFGQSQTPDDRQSQAERDILAKLDALEKRVAELEQTQSDRDSHSQSMYSPQTQQGLYRFDNDTQDTQKIQTQNRSTIANRAIPDEIPEGSLLMAEFAALHGVNRATMWRHCTSGIQGDRIETIERPKPGGRTGDVERWLSLEQQEEAIAFWRRHSVNFVL
jgi:excisionase family DNA binding protein